MRPICEPYTTAVGLAIVKRRRHIGGRKSDHFNARSGRFDIV